MTEFYLSELKKFVFVSYLDDLNAFHYPVDALICYASYYREFAFEERYKNTKLLLGTKYVPLRYDFSDCKRKIIHEKAKNILLLSGGTDKWNVLDKILDKIDKDKYENIFVVCGVFYKNYESLNKKYQKISSVHILKNISNLKDYMELADIAVSAAGTTMYELCAVGTPTVCYVLADNQFYNAMQFEKDGIAEYAGDARQDDIASYVVNYLNQYADNYIARKKYSVRMQMYVDGKGAKRIAKKMIQWNQ